MIDIMKREKGKKECLTQWGKTIIDFNQVNDFALNAYFVSHIFWFKNGIFYFQYLKSNFKEF